ncbi:MAG TPA: DUF3305 domain-containing protein [Aestuariivirgaceae bacterium]|nr:DUF3305 domain-containing protein [Aestuariivirgaceae bacterium]
MPKEAFKLGVLAQSRPPVTQWGGRVVRPMAVFALVPATAPGIRISEENGVETWYLGASDVTLHSGDTGHYSDNLISRRPSVWVALPETGDGARAKVQLVTVDPYEGEGLAGDDALVVEAVPMPDAVRARIEAFVAAHHVEIPFKKRTRKPVDVESDPRAPRILRAQDKWEKR